MILFKYIVDQDYSGNADVIERLISYVWNRDKTYAELCGIKAVINDYPENIAKQFYFTHVAYNNIEDDMIIHLMVSFSKDLYLTASDVKYAAEIISNIIGERYQVIYGIHTNKLNLHIHFIINSVSYYNGQKYKINTTLIPVLYTAVKEYFYNMGISYNLGGYSYEVD